MIGQKRTKKIGKLSLESGANLILVAPSGHGKTMLAGELAGSVYINLDSPYPPFEILELFEWNSVSKRIVCDEIHSCNKQDEWAIFLDRFLGNVIFTTTDPEKVIEAIKTRCFVLELAAYSIKELARISGVWGRNSKLIANLSRGIPRRASNLGILFKEFGGSMQDFLDMLGVEVVNNTPLFPEEMAYLAALENGPVGRENLKRLLNLADVQEVELSLLRIGLVKITHAGRELNL